jgi:hypothetical protein
MDGEVSRSRSLATLAPRLAVSGATDVALVPRGRALLRSGRRLVGVAVDLAVAAVLAAGVEAMGLRKGAAFAALIGLLWCYLTVCGALGATLGNLASGGRVVDASSGARLSIGRAALRALAMVWLTVSVLGLLGDAAYAAFDLRRCALHDLVVGAQVVAASPAG